MVSTWTHIWYLKDQSESHVFQGNEKGYEEAYSFPAFTEFCSSWDSFFTKMKKKDYRWGCLEIFTRKSWIKDSEDLSYLSRSEHISCAASFDLLVFQEICRIILRNELVFDSLVFGFHARFFRNWPLLQSNDFALRRTRKEA